MLAVAVVCAVAASVAVAVDAGCGGGLLDD